MARWPLGYLLVQRECSGRTIGARTFHDEQSATLPPCPNVSAFSKLSSQATTSDHGPARLRLGRVGRNGEADQAAWSTRR